MQIDQAAAQGRQLGLRSPLALGQPQQGQGFGFAVVEHRPIGPLLQQLAQPLPKPLLPLFLQGQ